MNDGGYMAEASSTFPLSYKKNTIEKTGKQQDFSPLKQSLDE